MNKLPPIEKIYEAYSAISDERVSFSESEPNATVTSSNRAKAYTVSWDGTAYSANDNATYWQGYPGYPVLAVLMLQGRLTLDQGIAGLFASVNWAELNQKYKRDYAEAVDAVIRERQYNAEPIHAAVDKVFAELKELDITIKRGALRPPKANKDS